MSSAESPLRLLQAPYDSGIFNSRMGAGPLELADAGAAHRLRELGRVVEEQLLYPTSSWQAELRTAFELQRVVAEAVASARDAGQVPLLLSGNCNATLGVLAGLNRPGLRLGLLWMDAHGDFNTPELDQSGFLDGQGLAMIVGRCWQALTSTVPGFAPVREQDVVLVGARSVDDAEALALQRSQVAWLSPAQTREVGSVSAALNALAARVELLHVHIDLDVHDPSIAPANGYAVPDGLTAEEVQRVVQEVAVRVPVGSATLASYDPAYDFAGRMRDTALDLLRLLGSIGAGTCLNNRSRPVGD